MGFSSQITTIGTLNSGFNFINTETELFNGMFNLGQFLLFLFILISGLILTAVVPSQIAKALSIYFFEVDKKTSKKYKKFKDFKKIEQVHKIELQRQIKNTFIGPLQNLLRLIIFSVYGLLAFFALGFTFTTQFDFSGYDFTLRQIITFFLVLVIFILFIQTTLSPLLRITIYMFFGRSIKRSELNLIHRSLLTPFVFLFILIMLHSSFILGFPNLTDFPLYFIYENIMIFLNVIIGTYFIVSIILTILYIEFTLKRKMDKHAAVALGNFIYVIGFLIAIFILIATYGVNATHLQSLALVIAAIGFAIGFGMQNTIANIMAGFALATDKPFTIGDRIRVGPPGQQTWGDVTDIGLNTTKIRTIEEETVVIPNNYIASNEVWNYTKGSPILALTFQLGISYGSNWRLAKKIIIDEAQKHPYILRKPQPFVRIEAFQDFSIGLKVWAWLRNARDKDQIRSDLLEAIKDRFDAEGVEIPFPYRTIVYKKDLSKEKQLPVGVKFDNVRRYPSKGRDYFEVGEGPLKGLPVSKVVHEEDVKILTPVSGIHNAKRLAEYSMSLARKINGNVTAVFILKKESKEKELAGLKALSIFENYGTKYNINVATKIEHGGIVEKILEIIDRDRINLVVIGGGRKAVLGKWGRESVANELIERATVPVVTMPYKLKWY